MPSWFDIGNIWKNLREIDLRPIRAEAERPTWIALVGHDENAKASLSQALCTETRRVLPDWDASHAGPDPLTINLDDTARGLSADLIVLLIEAGQEDQAKERELFQYWGQEGKKVVVVYNQSDTTRGFYGGAWSSAPALRGAVTDHAFLENEFVPAVIQLLPDRQLSLARYYPLFRMRVAQQLIMETSTANASYSLTTGLAEIIPILDVPFNVADMIVLTKAQAIMAYKLGLVLGLSSRWQDHMTAFGGTVGGGFLWRQVARELVGLIPVWGVIPKVAVAYAGTYVLGQAIMQWYLTGRQVTPEMMRQFYRDAFEQGKSFARTLLQRAPQRKKLPKLSRPRLPSRTRVTCANCGASNPGGNKYCGNCGSPLGVRS